MSMCGILRFGEIFVPEIAQCPLGDFSPKSGLPPLSNFTSDLVRPVLQLIYKTPLAQRAAGGALGLDAVILTGGGIGLLYKGLLPLLNHERVILADDLASIHLANVRGGLKLWRLYEALLVI